MTAMPTQGFVDGRMSGKWHTILTGLRPRVGGATTPSPPLLGAQGALREHEMAQLEKSMRAMGCVRACVGAFLACTVRGECVAVPR